MWQLSGPDPTWQRPSPTRDEVRRDVLLAAALVVASLLTVELMRATPVGAPMNQRLAESYLWSAAITAPLALRRVCPVAAMVICSVVFFVDGVRVPVTAASAVVQVALFMAIYAAWAWARHRTRLVVFSAVVVLGMFAWLAQLIAAAPTSSAERGIVPSGVAVALVTLAINVVYFFGAIAWGSASRRDAHRRELLVEQTEALRREQGRNARRAVAEDRLRIARDLHDAVAHHVTGIGVQAAAARHVLSRDPVSSATALSAIERSSRDAVREMHQIVGLLRDDDDPGGTERPGLKALPELAAGDSGDGLSVRFREVGEPFPVPEAVGTSVFRTAQEALTNVRRHSTAREAEMVLRYLGETASRVGGIEVEVTDAGSPVPRSRSEVAPGGYGLTGLRERAAAHGGTADIGPRPDGGYRVRVRFPVDVPADDAADSLADAPVDAPVDVSDAAR